jgi:hypothetical protein
MDRVKTILGVVHVTATPPGYGLTMKKLADMHKARGFSTVGYNGVIFIDGRFEISPRGLDGVGAHVAGFNSISLGISMEGGVDKNNDPSFATIRPEQMATLLDVMQNMTTRYPKIKWCGHRDLSPDKNGDGIIEPYEWMKACPTFDVIPWASANGLPVADIKGTWKVGTPLGGSPELNQTLPVVLKGPDMREAYLQRLLSQAGFKFGPIDGILGDKTKKAIRQYQAAHGLNQTGIFDAKTTGELRSQFES